MKKIYHNILYCSLAALLLAGCTKKLVEDNHSRLTPEFFATQAGFETGLTAAYAGLRDYYGPEEGIEAFTIPGTDEIRIANGSRTKDVANYTAAYMSTNEFSARMWNTAYKFINTCNGLVDYGTAITGIAESKKAQMLGEAKFLRAFYYFKLVQFFGDATLNKHFQNTPTTSATRESKAEIYKFIISDLDSAVKNMVPSPKTNGVLPGKATAAAARHLLGLVYLTRAYSSAAEATDFRNAFDILKGLITDAGSLGLKLLPDYANVHKALNENSEETLFTVQYSTDLTYGGSQVLNHLFVTGYHVQLGDRNVADGRPYVWYTGTKWLYDTAFMDKTNDTRYYKSFQSVWYATKPLSGKYYFTVDGVKDSANYNFKTGDTAMYMPGFKMTAADIKSRKYYVYTPENYTNLIFPTLRKFLDPNRLTANENSYRPIIVYRLADTYLLAAEAALALNEKPAAAGYITEVRKRAAKAGSEAAMTISASDVTLDFILDERARELCAENMRWLDLVRTNKLLERVKAHDDWEAKKNILPKHVIRPVPLSQLDAVITGPKYPQNTDW